MSVRLEPCDQTSDDAVIWAEVVFRLGTYGTNAGPLGQVVWTRSLMQDRRDGELMLEAQQVAEWGPAAIDLYGIACRGWNERGYWIEDTDDGEGIWQRD